MLKKNKKLKSKKVKTKKLKVKIKLKYLLISEIATIDVSSSNVLSRVSHSLSWSLFIIMGPRHSIPDPFNVSTRSAKLGAM